VQATELSAASLDQDFAEFAQARQLVLPFDDQPPWLAKSLPGGVLAMQRNAWLAQGHAASDLIWLDLRADPSAEPQGAARFVADLDVAPITVPQLLARLERASDPPPPSHAPRGVRIFIFDAEGRLQERLVGLLFRSRALNVGLYRIMLDRMVLLPFLCAIG
jgi:hypothetical protein